MILSDRTIREQVDAGRIVIEPFDPQCVQPSSVDLHLDRYFRVFRNHTMGHIDVKKNLEELTELLEADDDDPRLDDSDARRPTGGRVLAIAPVALLVAGIASLVVGGVANVRGLVALGLICFAGAFLLFVVAPLAVVLESRRHDRL